MKLQQLRYAWEIHRHGNHISAAADALHTSQPGISKQIQLLEGELGFEIFSRKRNRIVGLTEPGREVIAIAQRMLSDIDNLRNLGEDFTARSGGNLIIATTQLSTRRMRLRARDASHLFASSTIYITMRANTYLRRFAYDFIRSLAPALTTDVVQSALKSAAREPLKQ